MKRTFLSLLYLGAVALVASPVGCGRLDSSPAASEDDGTESKEDVSTRVLVRLGDFRVESISTRLSAPADLEAVEEADFYPEVTGIVHEIRFREGDPVKKNDTVVLLVDDSLRLVRETKELSLEDARTKSRLAAVAVKEGQAIVDQKSFALQQAQKEHERADKHLKDEGIISPEALDSKLFAVKQAEGDLKTAELALERLRIEVAQGESNEKLAAKEVETALFNHSRSILRSPIDGHISFLDHKRGELVSPSTLVFSVVNLDRLRARVHVPQRELRRLKVGQPVEIACDVFPGEAFTGKVDVINPVIDTEKGTVRVTVSVKRHPGRPKSTNPVAELKPGMFIDGEIITATHEKALLVDKRSVLYENRRPTIYLVGDDGKARQYAVTPGFSSKTHLEVFRLTHLPEGGAVAGEDIDLSLRRVRADGIGELAAGRPVLVGQNKLKDLAIVEVENATKSDSGSVPVPVSAEPPDSTAAAPSAD